jgi:vancomycin resistance protein YoaR
MTESKSASLPKRKSWRMWSAVMGSLALVATLYFSTRDRVAAGIYIGDVTFGNLTWSDADSALRRYADRRVKQPIAFAGDTGICVTTPEAMGVMIDLDRSRDRLRQLHARMGRWRGWFGASQALLPHVIVGGEQFNHFLSDCASRAIAQRPTEGRLQPKDGDFVITPSQPGRRIDVNRLLPLIEAALGSTSELATPLPLTDQPEFPTRAALEQARVVAFEVTSKAVTLRSEVAHSHITLLRADLTKMLEWQTTPAGGVEWHLSRPAFDQWLAHRRQRAEQRARDATYELDRHNKLVVVEEQNGNRIATDALFTLLEKSLREGQRQIDIPFEPTELPKRRVADLEALNIREPVGEFTTRHACCQPRVNNIHRIADLINGTIIAPDETYSINQHVGQRSLENGFVPAPSIEDGEMVDTIGGGVSQFATTFYNAMLRGGYEILERQAHTYWFDRYPMGHEATLSWPHPDIVVHNDTRSGILILTSYTDRSITVKLFGDREGRRVDISVSPRFDIVRPAIEYLPNLEIEPDDEKVKEGGCIGWSVWTMRTVTLKDGTTKKDKRKVIYKPRVRRVEVHPCKIPKGEPGHTGEKCPIVQTEREGTDAPTEPVKE